METLTEMKDRKFKELPVPTKNIEHLGFSRKCLDIPPDSFWTPEEKRYPTQSNLYQIATKFPLELAAAKKLWMENFKKAA